MDDGEQGQENPPRRHGSIYSLLMGFGEIASHVHRHWAAIVLALKTIMINLFANIFDVQE